MNCWLEGEGGWRVCGEVWRCVYNDGVVSGEVIYGILFLLLLSLVMIEVMVEIMVCVYVCMWRWGRLKCFLLCSLSLTPFFPFSNPWQPALQASRFLLSATLLPTLPRPLPFPLDQPTSLLTHTVCHLYSFSFTLVAFFLLPTLVCPCRSTLIHFPFTASAAVPGMYSVMGGDMIKPGMRKQVSWCKKRKGESGERG